MEPFLKCADVECYSWYNDICLKRIQYVKITIFKGLYIKGIIPEGLLGNPFFFFEVYENVKPKPMIVFKKNSPIINS